MATTCSSASLNSASSSSAACTFAQVARIRAHAPLHRIRVGPVVEHLHVVVALQCEDAAHRATPSSRLAGDDARVGHEALPRLRRRSRPGTRTTMPRRATCGRRAPAMPASDSASPEAETARRSHAPSSAMHLACWPRARRRRRTPPARCPASPGRAAPRRGPSCGRCGRASRGRPRASPGRTRPRRSARGNRACRCRSPRARPRPLARSSTTAALPRLPLASTCSAQSCAPRRVQERPAAPARPMPRARRRPPGAPRSAAARIPLRKAVVPPMRTASPRPAGVDCPFEARPARAGALQTALARRIPPAPSPAAFRPRPPAASPTMVRCRNPGQNRIAAPDIRKGTACPWHQLSPRSLHARTSR